ncbi:AAA family ATPase, partial [Dialister sp.]|uniref:AAA family ATPase n=1 Tax=Dialister sp. TaxID=1955814 RepID=UPI003F09A37F
KGAKLPLEAVPEIILDEGALENPEGALDRAFDYWRQNLHFYKAPELSRGEFRQMIDMLMPTFHMTRTISSMNREAQPDIISLTRQQGAVLDFLEDQQVCAVHGPAGTGKTVLAVEKARRLAEEGRKVLYLCYNEFLLEHIRRENQGSPVSFHNVRSLAEELMGKCAETDAEEVRAFEAWFPEEGESLWPYEDVVVDEGQDMTDTMLETLWLLTDERDGAFYVFYDRNQRVIRREKTDWIDANAECRVVLSRDVRNTAEIASSMASVIGLKRRKQYINEVHGLRPCMSLYRDPAGLRRICDNFVKEMLDNHVKLEDMVILSIHSLPHSGLAGVDKIYGIPVSVEPEAGKVWLTNVYRFKGLEAKAVLLIDVEMSALAGPFTSRLIYTGGSRAAACLKLALKEDIPKNGYEELLSKMGAEGKSAKDLAAFWGMEIK